MVIMAGARLESEDSLTLFVPYALGCPMPATPPWQTLGLMSLSWWKREVEEMIKRLR
jgi:hypothetical protein